MGLGGSSMAADKTDVKKFVDEAITGWKLVMFSKSGCPFCTRAKGIVKEAIQKGMLKQNEFRVVEIAGRSDCQEIQGYLQELTGARTVPRVFVNGKPLGGCDQLSSAFRSGELEKRLKENPAPAVPTENGAE